MADIKLFQVASDGVRELAPQAAKVEKSLQTLFVQEWDALLGVRFLASEYSTGPVHGGRIDTLGLDEDGSPVIIEYKRSMNENVINQGLFYLDWLMDHQKEFQWLVLDTLGHDVASKVEWSAPRLVCIAGDFTRYDGYAVKQINRNIELIRYRRFGNEHLMIDVVHATRTAARAPPVAHAVPSTNDPATARDPYQSQRIDYRLSQASTELRDVWEASVAFLTALGDDVQVKELKLYVAFKRIKNFACKELYPQKGVILIFLKLNPASVPVEPGFIRDVSKIGHFGTGDVELSIRTLNDVIRAQPLLMRAYEGG